MPSLRPLLRRWSAILRVASLLVLIPVCAQAHAGHGHGAGAPIREGATVHHVARAAAGTVRAVLAAPAAQDPAACFACPGCCCGHVCVAAASDAAGRGDRAGGRRVAPAPESAPASAVPEAIPEPPRSSA